MANKSFDVKMSQSAEIMIEKAWAAAMEIGGTFIGDVKSGSFEGKGIVGDYVINGDIVTVTISHKPWYAPFSMVESKVREFFA